MKKRIWLKYIMIITLILLVVFCGVSYFDANNEINRWNSNYQSFISYTVFYVILGLIIGLELFIQEAQKSGKWRIDIAKLIILGIPSLYFSLGIYLYFGLGRLLPSILTYPIAILISSNTGILPVFQMILGYSIITSFYKTS